MIQNRLPTKKDDLFFGFLKLLKVVISKLKNWQVFILVAMSSCVVLAIIGHSKHKDLFLLGYSIVISTIALHYYFTKYRPK